MSKQRRTVSLDPDVDEYLDAEGVNASQLVNRLVRNYHSADGDELAMLRLREQQLKSEVEELESRLQSKRNELETVQEKIGEQRNATAGIVREAIDHLPEHVREPDNPAVENWASKAGMSPEELLERIEDLSGGDEIGE